MNYSACRGTALIARLALLLGFIAGPTLVRAQEMIDNPQYTTWAKQKPASSLTYNMDVQAAGQDIPGTIVHKLIEVTPDQVTIEVSRTQQMMGQSRTSPPQKVVYKAKLPKAEESQTKLPPNVKGTIKQVGEESLDVGGKSVSCKILEYEGTMASPQNPQVKGRIWRSEDVPGGLVKMQQEVQAGMAAKMTMQLQSMDLK